jgi:hypothetical protein
MKPFSGFVHLRLIRDLKCAGNGIRGCKIPGIIVTDRMGNHL